MSSWTHWGLACTMLSLTLVTPWAWAAVAANVVAAVGCSIFSTKEDD